MKLWTPAFHFSVACGYRSPTEVSESEMLPVRVVTIGPSTLVSVPSMPVLARPNRPVMPIAKLAAKHRRAESVSGIEKNQIGLCVQAGIQIDVHGRWKSADLDLPCRGDGARCFDGGVIIHRCHRPARHLRGCRKATEAAGKPVRNTALVGAGGPGQRSEHQQSRADAAARAPDVGISLRNAMRHLLAPNGWRPQRSTRDCHGLNVPS